MKENKNISFMPATPHHCRNQHQHCRLQVFDKEATSPFGTNILKIFFKQRHLEKVIQGSPNRGSKWANDA